MLKASSWMMMTARYTASVQEKYAFSIRSRSALYCKIKGCKVYNNIFMVKSSDSNFSVEFTISMFVFQHEPI